MFSMTKIKAVNGAGKAFYANHLAANDYYSEKEIMLPACVILHCPEPERSSFLPYEVFF